MPMIEAFFTQRVTIKSFVREGNGEPLYGKEETRKCRLELSPNLRTVSKNAGGQIDQVPASARMFCVGSPIPARSIVVHDGQEYTVISCASMGGFAGDHLEVFLE